MLPITIYNEKENLETYRQGATLGVTKLEYIVGAGVKQVNLQAKLELEDLLKLDQLKPLSTSYTQNDNSKQDGTPVKSEDTTEDGDGNETPVEDDINNKTDSEVD